MLESHESFPELKLKSNENWCPNGALPNTLNVKGPAVAELPEFKYDIIKTRSNKITRDIQNITPEEIIE